MATVAAAVELEVVKSHEPGGIMDQILAACRSDEETYLDVIDATLRQVGPSGSGELLRRILEAGNSAWTVSDDYRRLERRVTEAEASAFAMATQPVDQAADELVEAWEATYGLHPNPSDAWDHAIKAVEAVLIPIVVPNQSNATLGHVLGALESSPQSWTIALVSNAQSVGSVEALTAMLRHMWPNPDRHGGGGATRAPTQLEAQAVVQLAVAVVQWARTGVIAKA